MNWFSATFEISHDKHKIIYSMEGVRGFAVFLVFLVHYMTLIEPWILVDSLSYKTAFYVRKLGNLGVDLFFVISGYLIYGMLIKKHIPFKNYILRRIQRIYPVFTVVFIFYIVLSFVFVSESKIPLEWVSGLLFVVQNYLLLPGLFDIQPIITVAWSLSYEFFYYLTVPLLLTVLSMRSWGRNYRVAFFVVISIILFIYSFFNVGYVRLLMFIPGILVFELLGNCLINKYSSLGLVCLFSSFFVVVLLDEFEAVGVWKYICIYGLFFLFFLDCFSQGTLSYNLFSASYARWLGNISYSYYLMHGLALKAIFLLIGYVYPANHECCFILWILVFPVFFLTLIPSSILFIYIEKPYSFNFKK